MASDIFMGTRTTKKCYFNDGLKCGCMSNISHYAIIAKGNKLDGLEAKE